MLTKLKTKKRTQIYNKHFCVLKVHLKIICMLVLPGYG